MNICVFGTGYVGLVTGTCFAEKGNFVWCVDTDSSKIEMIKSGILPIYEPGLQDLVLRNHSEGRLHFTTDTNEGLKNAQLCFITVGTPSLPNGKADISRIILVAESIGRAMDHDMIIVNKSTVPIGTSALVADIIKHQLSARHIQTVEYEVVSNPEFLREGSAVNDFMHPDRIIIGTRNLKVAEIITDLYHPFIQDQSSILIMDNKSAEITKYAANAMLATRISFINEIAHLCDKVGGDVEKVRLGIGSDTRIGFHFLSAGLGYGGSCFPKDVKELISCGREHGLPMEVVSATEKINNLQKCYMVEMVKKRFGMNLKGKTFGLWGLAFKPQTDDMRDAPSIEIIKLLAESGADIIVYDPAAMNKATELFESMGINIKYADNMLDAVRGADALLLITDWSQFRNPDFTALKANMAQPVIFDGRNLYEPETVKAFGFEYYCIGRSCHVN